MKTDYNYSEFGAKSNTYTGVGLLLLVDKIQLFINTVSYAFNPSK